VCVYERGRREWVGVEVGVGVSEESGCELK